MSVQLERRTGGDRITIGGELDMSGAPNVRRAFAGVSPTEGVTLFLDLADVSFVDSVGLAPILEARDRWAAAGASLVIERQSPMVRRLLALWDGATGSGAGRSGRIEDD